jgi:hypothetical protein
MHLPPSAGRRIVTAVLTASVLLGAMVPAGVPARASDGAAPAAPSTSREAPAETGGIATEPQQEAPAVGTPPAAERERAVPGCPTRNNPLELIV